MRSVLFFVFLIFCLQSNAQTIKGRILNEEMKPVPDASVTIKDSFLGMLSDASGNFALAVKQAGVYTVIIRSVGYEPAEQVVNTNDKTDLQVILKTAISSLEEVTVTAGRKPEIVNRTPASVQVINAAEIKTQALISSDISHILAQAAPAMAFGTNTTSNTGQTLRGRSTLVLIDGIPQSTPLRAGGRDIRTIDPAVIERVEIVKGATAMYGNGADGGIINYITKKSTGVKAFNAETYVGLTGMPVHGSKAMGGRFTQQFNGTIKKLDYIFSGSYEKTGVHKDAKGVPLSPVYGLGESSIYNLFSKIGYNITDKQRLEAMYNYFGSAQNSDYIEKTGLYGVTPTIGIKGEHLGEKEGTRYNHNAYIKYLVKDLPLHTSLDASAYLQRFYTIYGFTSYFENGGQSTIKSAKKGLRLNFNTPYKIKEWWNGDFVYGVDVLQDITSQFLTDGRTWVPELKLNNSAPYLQANATFFTNWIFKAGYRYDHININIPSFTQVKASNGVGGTFVNGGNLSFNASTFNTGLRYAQFQTFQPFISYTQGFSIIDVGRYVRSAKEDDIERMQIQPVKVNNYEAGFNSRFSIIDIAAAYFISTNKVGASLIEENGLYVQQKAPEKTYGFEVSIDAKPVHNLNLGASYMYAEGKADINKNNSFDDAEDIYLNGTKISSPKTTAYVRYKPTDDVSLYIQWLHFGDRNRFQKRGNGTYAFGEGVVDGKGVINFSGSWKLNKNINVNLGIENLLNSNYFTPIAQWSAQNSDYVKARGINFQLGLGIKW
jgi:iron complex outermembrane recepter protein